MFTLYISGNDQTEKDTDDRWGIATYVLRRDKLDQRQADLIRQSEEMNKEEDNAIELFNTAFAHIQKEIASLKAAILEFEVIFFVCLTMRLYGS